MVDTGGDVRTRLFSNPCGPDVSLRIRQSSTHSSTTLKMPIFACEIAHLWFENKIVRDHSFSIVKNSSAPVCARR